MGREKTWKSREYGIAVGIRYNDRKIKEKEMSKNEDL